MAIPKLKSLRLSGVHYRFGAHQVLEDMHLELIQGRTLAVVGQSGCGKTTLLRLCAGLLPLQQGHRACDFKRIATVFQQPRLLPWKTVRDNLTLVMQQVSRPVATDIARQLVKAVELEDCDLDKYPHQLSGGMQSRVSLARAMAVQPDVLLLDEPFSALDIGLKQQCYRLLNYPQWRQCARLLITHDLAEALRLADDILILRPAPGRVALTLSITEPEQQRHDHFVYQQLAGLLSDQRIREVFNLPSDVSANSDILTDKLKVAVAKEAATTVTGSTC